jgi:hypothetical protein
VFSIPFASLNRLFASRNRLDSHGCDTGCSPRADQESVSSLAAFRTSPALAPQARTLHA